MGEEEEEFLSTIISNSNIPPNDCNHRNIKWESI